MTQEWQVEFDDPDAMYQEINKLRKELVKERSKNAFVEVTGKSLADIHIDGIFEMLTKLEKSGKKINKENVENYATNMTSAAQ